MKRVLNVMLVLVLYSMIVGATEALNGCCDEHCHSPFGARIGQSFLTPAYSNCCDRCVKHDDHFISIKGSSKKQFTGMKWQCVEYSRRWWIENKGLTFADVHYAYHIWNLKSATKVDTGEFLRLRHFKNKRSTEAPKVGDLLIYSNGLGVFGHVAVIVGVEPGSILIAEQNYFNRVWEGPNYARRLMLDKNQHGHYRIYDDSVIGWVRGSV